MFTLSLQEWTRQKKYFPRLLESGMVMGEQPMSLGDRSASSESKNEDYPPA